MRSTPALERSFPPSLVSPGRPRMAVLWAHLRAARLDRQLSTGTATWRSPTQAARSLQLTSVRKRRGLARALERLIEHAERPLTPFRGAVVQPCREQVHGAMPVILEIATCLRSPQPVNARGVALLRGLLSDGAGPCYTRSRPDALTIALQDVADALVVQD